MSKRYPGGIIRKTPQTPSQTSAQGIWDMASVTQAVKENTWPIAGVPDPISKSLRFRSSASAYLNRTPASAGNRKTWTWSAWVKRSNIGTNGVMLGTETVNSQTYCSVYFVNDKIFLDAAASNVETMRVYTNAVFRDPSAWYHVVVYLDTTQATAANRTAIYVNGVLQTLTVSTNPAQNLEPLVNSTVAHNIGRNPLNLQYFDGYMTEIYLIDGQALTPSSFGSTNDQTGVWQPVAYTGTYGTNGFYLPFSNTASTTTLGYDFSGNSNNWTTNNISLTSGSTYDSMVDVPTQWIPYNTAGDTGALFRGNYCTLNAALQAGGYTLNDGNLNWARTGATGGTNDRSQFGTIGVTSGKWYWEFTAGTVNANSIPGFGIAIGSASTQSWGGGQTGVYIYESDGLKYLSGTGSSYGAAFATGDIIGVAFDADAGTLTFYKNNVSQGQAASGLTSGPYFPAVTRTVGGGGSNGTEIANFGQRPFSYTPPSGFKTLCTTNLTTPTIGATASTTANKYFDATLYTGNGSSQSITNAGGFAVDFLIQKARSAATDNIVYDTLRGSNYLVTNSTAADVSSGIISLASTGFNVGSGTAVNANGTTYVGWQWRANGAGVTNTAGSITSTVSASTASGFSIVTYTGTGANATVGHGLGVTPAMVIVKRRSAVDGWFVYSNQLAATQYLRLNTTAAAATFNFWQNTAPTSSVFYISTDVSVNASSNTYVAYCFAPVAGYSAFGSYVGNDSADGTFIYTGFRPAFILYKKATGIDGWVIFDTKRNTYNVVDTALQPNTSGAEASSAAGSIDILSNGFKQRNANNIANSSSFTYIYMAFAELPFKYALAR